MSASQPREVLARGRHLDTVEDDRRTTARIGIEGVPFFMVDGRYGVSGAQPAGVFVQVLSSIIGER